MSRTEFAIVPLNIKGEAWTIVGAAYEPLGKPPYILGSKAPLTWTEKSFLTKLWALKVIFSEMFCIMVSAKVVPPQSPL